MVQIWSQNLITQKLYGIINLETKEYEKKYRVECNIFHKSSGNKLQKKPGLAVLEVQSMKNLYAI